MIHLLHKRAGRVGTVVGKRVDVTADVTAWGGGEEPKHPEGAYEYKNLHFKQSRGSAVCGWRPKAAEQAGCDL